MLALDTLVTFFSASVLLGLAPGPDNLFVLTQSALRGRGAGLLVTLGLCTGLIAHTAAVSLGVAAVFQTSALAFTLLKLVGAGYLLWLAWQAFRAAAAALPTGRAALAGWALYRRGIVMNVTNPKVSIFFLAFLLFSWTTGSIMSGALIERIRLSAYLILTALLGHANEMLLARVVV